MKLPSSTDAVHAGVDRRRAGRAVGLPVAQTATYSFDDTADLARYFSGQDPDADRQEYGRYGNTTAREVERRVAALDGAEDAALFASGMAAITSAIVTFVKAGDHVVVFSDAYRRTRQFVVALLGRFGVEHAIVDASSIAGLEAAMTPKTRVVITESPTNPYLR
ncbi:MAG TPA: aminotransferase class I/II-fold pyridoxal phosphate-dependent enzyme, partial [Byssovorax sp.]